MNRFIIVLVVVLSASFRSYATDYYTTGTGDWQSSAIWSTSPMGVGALWSTITLVAGDIIHINHDITINGSDVVINVDVTIIIDAELAIGKKLRLTTNSLINVTENGSIIATGGGNSNKISFGSGNNVWTGNDGPLSGPGDLDKDSEGVLPIELIFFNASVYNQVVDLGWATASEENFNYFSIERSFDGKRFAEIAQVVGNGSSFERVDYSYTDKFPAKGISYYRLRAIDFDGYTEIFDYAIVNVEGNNYDASIFPNPVTSGEVNVQVNFNLEESVQVLFYNNMGLLELNLAMNSWLSPVDVSSLAPGSYLIKIISTKGVFVKRILVK